MQRITFRDEIFPEGNVYAGLCPELNVSSFGASIQEARSSLQEAVEAFVEECEAMGTLQEVMEEVGFVKKDGVWISPKPVMQELLSVA